MTLVQQQRLSCIGECLHDKYVSLASTTAAPPMAQPLRTVVVNPTAKHTATVIFLHGLGDSGVGWLFLTEAIAPMLPHVKWVLPDA